MKNKLDHLTGWFKAKINAFRKLSRTRKILFVLWTLFSIFLITFIATATYFASTLSSKERIMNRNNTGVTLVDRNDEPFYEFYNARSNTYVTLANISETTQEALIAAEDKNFYNHAGFSPRGIIQAVYENVRPSGINSGGSTITQQLVKNSLLTDDRSLWRKYQELILSIEIERRYTKAEILEMYLNSVYFGEGAFGIEDAAQTYYGKPARELTTSEASMLIGLLPAPSAYSPISGSMERAKQRQAYVLDRMVEDGHIDAETAANAKAEELAFLPPQEDSFRAPHFALMVQEELLERYDEEEIARSGMTVKTTLDLNWQTDAENAVENQLAALTGQNANNASVVATDPKTGEILVLVGSRDWNNEEFGKVNLATTPRQPGSSFKPIVYSTGIEDKTFSAATIFNDIPTDFGGYRPQNYNLSFSGDVTLRNALARSLNIPAVQAIEDVGVGNTINNAEKLGITSLDEEENDYGLSLSLGSGQVPLTEMTNAYATFANQGRRNDLTTIISINDKNDKEIYNGERERETHDAISSETAYIMSSVLSDNVARAPAFGNALTLSRNAAVKTGTTEQYRGALTIGYTPNVATGVWVGNNDNSPMGAIGGSLGAAPIWRTVMERIFQDKPVEEFSAPTGIIAQMICRGSGAIAQNEGGDTMTEYFRSGTLPSTRCNESAPEPEEPPEEEQPQQRPPRPTTPEEDEDDEDDDPNIPIIPTDPDDDDDDTTPPGNGGDTTPPATPPIITP